MTEEAHEFLKATKRIRKIGGSYYLLLPQEYVNAHKLKDGDFIDLMCNKEIHGKPITKEEVRQYFLKFKEQETTEAKT
jgi:antitoxin component of MazEF toxin-antitoxin module